MKAYNGLYPYAFMSYSHKDQEKIKPLIDKLQSVGCNIWYDDGILPADEWAETVAKKLAGAKLFFLILSENAVASQNVKREIYYAVSNDITILTFYLEKVNLSEGLAMQLGVSQSISTKNDTEIDCSAIKSLFPTDTVASESEPEVIYSTSNYVYCFTQSRHNNEYSIIKIDRENKLRKTIFKHRDSGAFAGWYSCESIHFSPSDEFNDEGRGTLFFSVYSDLDHDIGVAAADLYVQVDFAIVNPNSKDAELKIVGGRKKRKMDSNSDTVVFENPSEEYWCKNIADT